MFRHVTAFFLFFVFALWTSVNASALIPRVDQCNTGVIFCCVSVQSVRISSECGAAIYNVSHMDTSQATQPLVPLPDSSALT
ncbi:hypothetical protein FPV67DRAFT_1490440 [Lyophyllum atratum]|nr:hypothetical protein FPV67DRAFT_1490440 [Lyophyllum atratum]